MGNIDKKVNYNDVIEECIAEFKEKHDKYGSSWLVFRIPSITEQVYIKVARVRSIQEKKEQKVQDPVKNEFTGIFNYCIFAKIHIKHLLEKKEVDLKDCYNEKPFDFYKAAIDDLAALYEKKNHDYGEVWRTLRISSMVDLCLAKILRFNEIYIKDKRPDYDKLSDYDEIVSDIANYAIFCKVLIAQGADPLL